MRCKAVLTFLLAFASARFACGADATALWSIKVQPIFDANCVKCHGLIQRKSGLELDSLETIMKGGDEGAVVVPGKPERSRLYHYLAPDSDPHMPPKKQLTDVQREARSSRRITGAWWQPSTAARMWRAAMPWRSRPWVASSTSPTSR